MKVETLDLLFQGMPRIIAAYLVEGREGLVLVETGPMSTLPALLEQLAARGVAAADVRHVLVTHIHLDHAGAAGWWAAQGAQVYVHPVGVSHLVNPERLVTSVRRIYGEATEPLWGQVMAAPEARVQAVYDGRPFTVAGLTVTPFETPGHAWHHHAYRIGDVAFCGDVGGVRLPEHSWLSFSAPPPEYNKEAWLKGIDRLAEEELRALYLTHFGRIDDAAGHLARLRELIIEATEFIGQRVQDGDGRAKVIQKYATWVFEKAVAAGLTEAEFERYEAVMPTALSVDGIMRYWYRRLKLV